MPIRHHGLRATTLGFCALLLAAAPSLAADVAGRPAPASANAASPIGSDWVFAVHSYTWATSLDGRFRTLPLSPPVDLHLGFGDVLKHLDGALMLSADARRDRFVVFADLTLARLSTGKTFSANGHPGRLGLSSSSAVGLVTAGYRVVDDPGFTLDLLAGVRGFVLSNTLSVQLAPYRPSYEKDRSWADAVGGARLTWTLSERMSATAIGLVGAGGANYEWDTFGGLGYRFTDSLTGFAGYRAMKVDYRRGSFVYDALQYGPLVGLRMTF